MGCMCAYLHMDCAVSRMSVFTAVATEAMLPTTHRVVSTACIICTQNAKIYGFV